MRLKTTIALALTSIALGGCVSTSEFNAYKAQIKADGEALDEWVAATHEWILFLNANMNTICPSCAPPALPPDPPPDGDWGE